MLQKRNSNLLITGASGMLGVALVNRFRELPFNVIASDIVHSTVQLDVSNIGSKKLILELKPDIIIHLAAYTDVDGCELNKERAWNVNVLGTKNLATLCGQYNIPLLYVSTDYVFDGRKPTQYYEWDKPTPISVYGKTKAEGEKWVQKLKRYWIVRTSGLYGRGGSSFVSAIINSVERNANAVIKVVNDQIGAPTYTDDLSYAISKLINTELYGTYHITNSGYCSWFEFAKSILKFLCIKCDVVPITSEELSRPAKRPKNFRLLNFAWETVIGKPLREWDDALKHYLNKRRL